MPMTFPAHQGLILPVVRRWPQTFDALALSVGAAMPDLTDTVLGLSMNGYFQQWYGHSLLGIFTLDMLGGLLLTWLIAVSAARFFQDSGRVQRLHVFLRRRPLKSDRAKSKTPALPRWAFSVFVGILSHIAFDLISHDTNLLFYPWYEDPRWFPEWWYATWFEIPPVPPFGHTYSGGIHTVIWGLLTIVGILLFFQFLLSKLDKNA